MLVLTRGIGEGLMIGDDIVVTVERISGGVIRLGIQAPRDALILRGEMLEAPQSDDRPSNGHVPNDHRS
jgi:carbon storage regulator